ncbi:hypothetical protein FIU82_10675 [Pseudoalteromonas sp. THAF3]|uniref:hypothetical protein n=1 Tax=Pseudoalteromonas sp. THAF3 TaxID=2587843 RepID=UPI001267B32A|nr:hypothetical protein [Pseudoalteromonas sp. THAF3]QFU05452.1 hypothetical protein FIU82_10675 [Pseudoalteromonas sp. THAF3]
MVFIILFGVVAISFIVFSIQMEAYKEAAHKGTEERKNRLVEYLSYQDQYWGMLFGNPKNFPLYHEGLDSHIKRVRISLFVALGSFFGLFIYIIVANGL